MAELSRFFGIIISMFGADHNPPHIHIRYGDFEAIITIQKEIVKGEMPARILKLVLTWIDLHKNELLANWENAQKGLELNKIEPLK
ncbi:MAG: DUF4160 domain-containing protein [Lentimicrobiaceae bacterium]|nr:DUF4160 domain-containing protein [Lentimicrobiaceae bacterium]